MKLLQKIKSEQSGIAHLGLIVAIVVAIGVAGFVGYNVWQKNNSSAATSYASKCGSGYKSKYNKGGLLVYVKDKGSKTDWCGFHVFKSDGSWTSFVSIKPDGQKMKKDSGRYKTYAGPVKASNAKCAKFEWGAGKNGRGFGDNKKLCN